MIQTKKNLYYQIRRLRAKRDKLKDILYSYENESNFAQQQFNDLKDYVFKVIAVQTCVFGTGLIIYLRTKIC